MFYEINCTIYTSIKFGSIGDHISGNSEDYGREAKVLKTFILKGPVQSVTAIWKNDIFGKIMKNGAFLFFTACSESL